MSEIHISENSSSEEVYPFARVIHELVSLPVTMRSRNRKGVRIEQGKLVDNDYTGPILEEALEKNGVIHAIPDRGAYKGVPVVVTPLHDMEGNTIAVIGVVEWWMWCAQ